MIARFLVATRVSLFPPEHGGAKNIRQIVESLAARGVECEVLIKLHPAAPQRHRFAGQFAPDLAAHASELENYDEKTRTWTFRGVRYRAVEGTSDDLARAAERAIERFRPDAFLLCDDALDDGRALFAVGAASGRLLFLAQTIHCLPFGPYAMQPSPEVAGSVRRARWIVSPSRYVSDYIHAQIGIPAAVYYPDVFGPGPFPELGRRENPFVTLINPCPWKGSSIFLKLARHRPELRFAAVPTWGATPALLDELRALDNVTLLPETSNIDDIFAQTRVLLTPSLCQEAFGLVSPEALLRGVPVIASDIAGLRESTVGAAPLIPVRPLPFDRPPQGTDHTKFVWPEPDNPVAPWSDALDAILSDDSAYRKASEGGRQAAQALVARVRAQDFLTLLLS